MNLECPECGSENVQTTIESEQLRYGRTEVVECETPVRHCNDCQFNWLDHEGMKVQDDAVKKYLKNKGQL